MDAFIASCDGKNDGEGLVEKGARVFIRTVTMYYTGTVEAVTGGFIHLSGASWVAWTGRFGPAMASGTFSEVEPYPAPGKVAISIGAIVEVAPWCLVTK